MVVHASTLYHVDPGNEAVPLATVVAARKHVCQVILIFLLESILEIDTSRKKTNDDFKYNKEIKIQQLSHIFACYYNCWT
jgi:hypothetical protein